MSDFLIFCFIIAPLVYPVQFALVAYAIFLPLLALTAFFPRHRP